MIVRRNWTAQCFSDWVLEERGKRQLQAGQGAADIRITARGQDLTPRNMDLEPILDLGSLTVHPGFKLMFSKNVVK